jgi:hypothetical protein
VDVEGDSIMVGGGSCGGGVRHGYRRPQCPSPVACVVISPNCLSVDRRVDFYLQFLPAILTS